MKTHEPLFYVDAKTLAEKLGVSRRTLFRLVSAGKLPQPIRLSKRTVRWDWQAVQEFLSSNANRSRRGGKHD